MHLCEWPASSPEKRAQPWRLPKRWPPISRKHKNANSKCCSTIGGEVQRVAWSARYNDLTELETVMNKITSDPKYWELVNSASDNFIPGSFHDAIWKTV